MWAWEKVVKAIKEAIEVKRDVLWPAGGQRMQEIDRELHGRVSLALISKACSEAGLDLNFG